MAKVLAPPPERHVEPDELEALIREARARQRWRRLLFMSGIALAAAVGLSVAAALRAGGGARHAAAGSSGAPASRGVGAGRRQVLRVGSSGGVTWAIDEAGMWLTTNGGRTWSASTPRHLEQLGQVDQRVQQVEFLDRRDGWITAVDTWSAPGSSELDWTHDGGRTWHRLTPGGCCGTLFFLTPSRGYMSGRALYATDDGGATWRVVVSHQPFTLGAVAFLDARRGIAVGSNPPGLFRTTDGGRRWKIVRPTGLSRIAVFGRRLVVPAELPGSSGPRLVAYVSDDGGSTWAVRPAPRWWGKQLWNHDERRFSAASSTAWYAAAGRRLAVTRDAGRSWQTVRPEDLPAGWIIGAIDFTSARVGWAVFSGPSQSDLMRTTDGGVHWTPAGPPSAPGR